MPYKWLNHDPDLPDIICGQYIDRWTTKTRVEEYWYVHDIVEKLEPGLALDAATGYVEDWHVLPYILGEMGWDVETMDIDARTLTMHPHPKVRRVLSDLISLPYADNHFDLVTCISTLEHLPSENRIKACDELDRVLKDGERLILTADNYPGISPAGLAVLAGPNYNPLDIQLLQPREESNRFRNGKRVAAFSAFKEVLPSALRTVDQPL